LVINHDCTNPDAAARPFERGSRGEREGIWAARASDQNQLALANASQLERFTHGATHIGDSGG
jgi:hypothetical protein